MFRKSIIVLLLGFSSGLPLALCVGTLQAWLTDAGLSVRDIGLLASITLPYSLKFIWSPLLERYRLPFGGRRRGWILVSVAAVVLGLLVLAGLDPHADIWLFSLVAFGIAVASATQDIAIDAYRTELLSKQELGPGASLAIFGYRMAMLVSGAGALALADHLTWGVVYQIMALLQCIGAAVALIAPEPAEIHERTRSLRDAVVLPFQEFFRRPGAMDLLIFILLYKFTDVMAAMFQTTFLLQVGFTKTQIAAVVKGFGLVAAIVGALAGGMILPRIGMKRALIIFGLLQGSASLTFAYLATRGAEMSSLAIAIGTENFTSGLGSAAFAAFLMSLCNRRFTATQYALLTSLAALTRPVLGGVCGYLATATGWQLYFIIATIVAIPPLMLVERYYERWAAGSVQNEV